MSDITNELTKLDAYYKILPKSKAKEAWDKYWEKRTQAWEQLRLEVAKIIGMENPLIATRGEFFSGICIEDAAPIPDDFRLANKKETERCDGKRFIYPDGKTKRGKILNKALNANDLTRIPGLDVLATELGFGYGKRFFTIGNKLYRECGYKEEKDEIKIWAYLFRHKDGKLYYANENKLVDQLPLLAGLVEILASQY